MEKAHAVIPIEVYDELKANKQMLEMKVQEVNALYKRQEKLVKATKMLTASQLNTSPTSRFDPIDILKECGLSLTHPYAGSRDMGDLEFID